VGHHRFIAQFEIIIEEPGNTDNSVPTPMTADLVQDLINEITTKAKPKDRTGKQYKVEKAEKEKKNP
jgi:hypothetical protein